MKKFLVALSAVAVLAACSGKGEGVADPNNGELAVESSSSVEQGSSSGKKAGSSSGSEYGVLSSSVKSECSSSVENSQLSSSSSVNNVNCLAFLEGETGWSWDVPKECRFNLDIGYGTMTDKRDGQVYRTVKIGDQVWMAENLNYDPGQGGSGVAKYDWSWCYYYDYEHKNCKVVGRFYTWAVAIDSVKLANDADNPQNCGSAEICTLPAKVQGVCPIGWHLPDTTEWNVLFSAVGGISTAGKALKSQTGWNKDGNGTDAFGFSALPAGLKDFHGGFVGDGYNVRFWSSTEYVSLDAYLMYLGSGDDGARILDNRKDYGFSVRCVKD